MRFLPWFFEYGLLVTFLVTGSVSLQAAQPVPTDNRGRPLYQAGVVAVKLRSDSAPVARKALPLRFGISSLDAVSDELGVRRVEPMFRTRFSKARPDLPDLSRIYRVRFPDAVDVRRAARLFGGDPSVAYAEPIVAHYLEETPNDPDFSRQWFLENIEAEAAWDVHKGEDGAEIVVGISDSGVAWRHEDLVENIYQNLGEDADGDGKVIEKSGGSWIFDPDDVNGIDDDGNGYVDDFIGWNFLNDDRQEDNDPDDPGSHGTHVAGLAAARTDNGIGISSISWNVKILPTSASNIDSGNTLEWTLSTVVYLAENGADIINMSWGSESTSQVQQEAIERARGFGSLLVAAAGNESTSSLHYPSALPGVVSVASVGKTDRLASYSNFGISVDVSAPGGVGINDIRSTIPPSNYGDKVGTSMASPVVAGVFALVKSLHPSWSNEELIEQVLGTADSIDDLNISYVGLLGEGRVNAFRALADQPPTTTPELRLEVVGMEVLDDNGDGSLEAGEGAEILLTMRNYSHLAGSDAVTLTLQTEASYVDVVNAGVTMGVTPDMAAELPSTFSIQVAPDAPSGLVSFTLSADASDATISPHSALDVQILIAAGGLLVWEGVEGGPTFSGDFLSDGLVSRGFNVTHISGEFPTGLKGFDGVFLSFGNAGLDSDGPPFSARLDATWKVDAIQSYLESGGRIFLDGGDTLGWDIYNLVDGSALLPLFGLEDAENDGVTNSIDSLDGHAGALTEGMQFVESSQSPVEWIDIFTPSTGGEAFSESDYGVVAVQHRGRYGQRTFCLSYTLAELVDGSTTRDDLLDAIVEFLGLSPDGGGQARYRHAGPRMIPASAGKSLSPRNPVR